MPGNAAFTLLINKTAIRHMTYPVIQCHDSFVGAFHGTTYPYWVAAT